VTDQDIKSVSNQNMVRKPWLLRHGKRIKAALIWTGFFLFLYLMSNFFSLIFLTFILSYTINSLVKFCCGKLTWPRWVIVVMIYSVLAVIIFGVGMIIFPKVYQEGKTLSQEIPETKDKLLAKIRDLMEDKDFSMFVEGAGLEEALRGRFSSIVQSVTVFLQNLFRTSFHLLLSFIFSFLILWDFDRFSREVTSLKDTRLGKIFKILSPKLVQFGDILGRAFEAQIIIAMANTLLTLIGLTYLGISSKLFLSVIVFFCSFIPVLGVFISSIPICLLAWKAGSIYLVLSSILLITIIHIIEAYILNPRIVGGHFSLHPFIAVSILVFSEYCFGIWGLLLGVPCAVFLYQSLIVIPAREEKLQIIDNLQKTSCLS